jgi:hypothetical protein
LLSGSGIRHLLQKVRLSLAYGLLARLKITKISAIRIPDLGIPMEAGVISSLATGLGLIACLRVKCGLRY